MIIVNFSHYGNSWLYYSNKLFILLFNRKPYKGMLALRKWPVIGSKLFIQMNIEIFKANMLIIGYSSNVIGFSH